MTNILEKVYRNKAQITSSKIVVVVVLLGCMMLALNWKLFHFLIFRTLIYLSRFVVYSAANAMFVSDRFCRISQNVIRNHVV